MRIRSDIVSKRNMAVHDCTMLGGLDRNDRVYCSVLERQFSVTPAYHADHVV